MKKKLGGFFIGLFSIGLISSMAAAMDSPGEVCAMNNDPAVNELVCFQRNSKGILSDPVLIATGGAGSGGGLDPLGSQGSLIFSANQQWLLAVNAGSDEISVLRVLPEGPVLVDIVESGGDFPVSVTSFHNLVYVLNGGNSPNITGFTMSHTGELTPIADSTRPLGSGAFAQVGFNPQGTALVVTDRMEHEILVFALENDGTPSATPVTTMSNGLAPFGFIFDEQGHLLVSEAASGAVTSYKILPDLTLEVISPSVDNNQAATCWIAGNGRHAFTANTASSNISTYAVKRGKGSLQLVDATAGMGDLDIDIAVAVNGRFLYALNAGAGTIGMFRIGSDGSLVDLGSANGGFLSIYAQGVAAR